MLQHALSKTAVLDQGEFFLVNSLGEHGPFNTYSEAVNAAESPTFSAPRFDRRKGYFVVDRREQESA